MEKILKPKLYNYPGDYSTDNPNWKVKINIDKNND